MSGKLISQVSLKTCAQFVLKTISLNHSAN